MIKIALIASIAAVPVSQCARIVVPAGGGSVVRPAAQPAQPQRPIAPGAGIHRIDDPDKPIQSQIIDYVWGDTLNEAEAKCRQIAAETGTTFSQVRRTSQKGKKWECHVLSNHPEPETDDRRR
ncbi:hypothetical protein H6F43_03520 [Leptolyngbya sp. FACHB-36]|uniref:hypothetical protein n=1 Tax=Leptolyngbya sp. FACHB-36 TaxID=2692808 RepID=UPI001680F419|nr:hypothetical protein [Leptolyngbya sp. FACHB-36]MBD2019251.1 hypothetical protein [Leptolyngbya sp. FACHB-36]